MSTPEEEMVEAAARLSASTGQSMSDVMAALLAAQSISAAAHRSSARDTLIAFTVGTVFGVILGSIPYLF